MFWYGLPSFVQFSTKKGQLITFYFQGTEIAFIFASSSIRKRTIMINLSKIFLGILFKLVPLLLLLWLATPVIQAQSRNTSVNVRSSKNGKTTISVKKGRSNSFSLEYEGDISISDDDKDILSISRGGYFEVKKSAFGNRRRIYMEPGAGGKLIKKYYVGSSSISFETEGRKWLAEILPEVLRSTSIGAEQRVSRIYKKGGTYAVLKEVENIESDYVKATYVKLLLQKNPSSKNLSTILEVVANDIDSDYHRADILKRNTKAFLGTEASTTAYIQAAGAIDSDYHKADILKQSVKDGTISQVQMKSLFKITNDIHSDYHKADILLAVMKNRTLDADNVTLLVNTSRDIHSDYHKAEVLKTALASKSLNSNGYSAFVSSMSSIDSDHHSADILKDLLKNKLNSGDLREILLLADDNISSDYHKGQVLMNVADKQDLQSGNLPILLEAIRGMSSDSHRASVFKQLAKQDFSTDQLAKILAATSSFSSDSHQTASLLAFAPKAKEKGGTAIEAYRKACNTISSETYFGRALRAIQ